MLCIKWLYCLYLVLGSVEIIAMDVPHNETTKQDTYIHLMRKNSNVSLVPPSFETGVKTEVTVQLLFCVIDSIDETSRDFSADLYVRLWWKDFRLSYTKPTALRMFKFLEAGTDLIDSLWVPDIHFGNGKKEAFHIVSKKNRMMHIYSDGSTLLSTRISLNLLCDMDLRAFPFDQQRCHLNIKTFSVTSKLLHLHWHDVPVKFRENIEIPQFSLKNITSIDCTKTNPADIGSPDLEFPCIEVELHLERNFGYYISQVYLPTGILVCLSWLSFWLDAEATPARISLGLLTVLTIITQTDDATITLYNTSYITAIDIWLVACLVMVFGALLEFAYVNLRARSTQFKVISSTIVQSIKEQVEADMTERNEDNYADDEDRVIQIHEDESNVDYVPNWYSKPSKDPFRRSHWSANALNRASRKLLTSSTNTYNTEMHKVQRIDNRARIIFPCVYLLFNILYWGHFVVNQRFN